MIKYKKNNRMIKTHLVISLLLITLINSCKAQKNDLKQDIMKTFDIETYNKNKNNLNDYTFITKDSTIVKQRKMQFDYYEIIKPKNSYFQTRNRYYSNGKLKSTVQDFPNDFLAGVMKEYDKQGTLIKETDYDKPYKFTFKDILKFIKKRGIDMKNYEFRIVRNIVNDKPMWSMTVEKEDKSSLHRIWIDGIDGAIIKEFDVDYPSEE